MQNGETEQSWRGKIDESGRLLIPAETRSAMGWERGTDVVIESDGDTLRVMSLDQFTREVQELFGRSAPGEPLLSEELIAERRREAACESRD